MKLRIETKSNLETVKLGRVLGEEILKNGSGNFLIALNGDLGSGKTTFIKGLGRGLGIKNKITSPTFLMVRRYSILKNKKYKNFYHVDAYRIKTKRDLEVTGIEAALSGQNNIIAVEWADLIKKHLKNKTLSIYIKHKNENKRIFLIS